MARAEIACPVNPSFDPLSAEYLADPVAVLETVPAEQRPIFFAPKLGYYVVTDYAEVDHAFRHAEVYSAANTQQPLVPLVPEAQRRLRGDGAPPRPSMVSLDPPEHARLRGPAARAFTPRRVERLQSSIEGIVRDLLDKVADAPRFDVVAALAHPLPATVIFALLGVPRDDWAQLTEWCGYRAALSWGRPAPEDQIEIASNLAAFRRYLHDLVRRKATDRDDDLTSDLLAIHDEAPDRLEIDEIASILFSLSFAGHETTTGLIGNMVRQLLVDRSRWDDVVRHPELAAGAVDETLRFDTSVPAWRRVTRCPTTLGGIDLPAGANLLLWLTAANRDRRVFADPDRFDVRRQDAQRALAFGKGPHACLGAALGKLEARVALLGLMARFPDLRLDHDQALTFHPNISFRGPQALWLVRPNAVAAPVARGHGARVDRFA
jgi:cytochrome P450